MAIFNKDMVDLATKNTFWQKEVYRDPKVQIVLMSIPAGEEIGMETHPADQTTFIVAGDAQVVIDGHSTKAGPNHMVVVPQGLRAQRGQQGSGRAQAVLGLCAAGRAGGCRVQDQGRSGRG